MNHLKCEAIKKLKTSIYSDLDSINWGLNVTATHRVGKLREDHEALRRTALIRDYIYKACKSLKIRFYKLRIFIVDEIDAAGNGHSHLPISFDPSVSAEERDEFYANLVGRWQREVGTIYAQREEDRTSEVSFLSYSMKSLFHSSSLYYASKSLVKVVRRDVNPCTYLKTIRLDFKEKEYS